MNHILTYNRFLLLFIFVTSVQLSGCPKTRSPTPANDEEQTIVCGDGVCHPAENCTCQDCACAEGFYCRPPRQCIARNQPDPDQPDPLPPVSVCGNALCEQNEDCNNCLADCGCDQGQVCSPNGSCEEPACTPNCDGNADCAPDGCGGFCQPCLPEIERGLRLMQTGWIEGPDIEPQQSIFYDFSIPEAASIEIIPASRNLFNAFGCLHLWKLELMVYRRFENQTGEPVGHFIQPGGYNNSGFIPNCGSLEAHLNPGEYRLVIRNTSDPTDLQNDQTLFANQYLLEMRTGNPVCGNGILNIGEACDGANIPGSNLIQDISMDRCQNCAFQNSANSQPCFVNSEGSTYRDIGCFNERNYCKSISIYEHKCREHICGNRQVDEEVPELGFNAEECDLGERNGEPNSGCSEDCQRTEVIVEMDLMQTGYFRGPDIGPGSRVQVPFSVEQFSPLSFLSASPQFTREECEHFLGLSLVQLFDNGSEVLVEPQPHLAQVHYRSSAHGCKGLRVNLNPGNYKLILSNLSEQWLIEENSYVLEVREGEENCGNNRLNIDEACDGPNINGAQLFSEYLIDRCEGCEISGSEVGENCLRPRAGETYRNISCLGESAYCPNLCDRPAFNCQQYICKQHTCGDGILDGEVLSQELEEEVCDAGDENGVIGSRCTEECTIPIKTVEMNIMQSGLFPGPSLLAHQTALIDFSVQEQTSIEIAATSTEFNQRACNTSALKIDLAFFRQNEVDPMPSNSPNRHSSGYHDFEVSVDGSSPNCAHINSELSPGNYRIELSNRSFNHLHRNDIEQDSYILEVRVGDEPQCGDDILSIGEACDGPNIHGADIFAEYLIDRCEDCQITDAQVGQFCFDNTQPPAYKNIACTGEDVYCKDFACKTHFCGDGVVDEEVPGIEREAEQCDLGFQNGEPDSGCNINCRSE